MSAFLNTSLKAIIGLTRRNAFWLEFAFCGGADYSTSSYKKVRSFRKNDLLLTKLTKKNLTLRVNAG